MKPSTSSFEEAAGRVITRFLGGRFETVDPGGGAAQLHDLDVYLLDGRVAAVEVTRHNLPIALATLSETKKRSWAFGGLTNHWCVKTIVSPDVRKLHKELSGLLVALERAGVQNLVIRPELFDAERNVSQSMRQYRDVLDATGTADVGQRLFDLGVRHALAMDEASPGRGEVLLGEAPVAGTAAPSSISDAVAFHANLPDNRSKLSAAADRDQRHLFVWAESSRAEVVAAFHFAATFGSDGLPATAPQLPREVDVAWIATDEERARVCRYSRSNGWENLGRIASRI
jgi:hypothetical protein